MYRIAFTGHRPNKLGGYNWSTPANRDNGLKLKKAILEAIKNSGDTEFEFYFGGALGTDQMAFEIVDFLQAKHPEWKFTKVLCVPFKDQPNAWIDGSKAKYFEQMGKAEQVVYVDTVEGYAINGIDKDIYHPAKMQKRNEYMVDNCDLLIALYNGDKSGGTANCVKYAKKKQKNIVVIEPTTV